MKPAKPSSPARVAASRANGAKSRGPVTAIGKYNSSRNSTRHGILSRFLVLSGEMPGLFRQQYEEFLAEHQPRTPTERALVEEMVTSWWRKQRVWGLESASISYQMKQSASLTRPVPVTDPATAAALAVTELSASGRSLDLYLRYETRYERQFHRALARLLDLKSRPPATDLDNDNTPPAPAPSAQPQDGPNNAPQDPAPQAAPLTSPNEPVAFPAGPFPSRDSHGAVPPTPANTKISTRTRLPLENKAPATRVPCPEPIGAAPVTRSAPRPPRQKVAKMAA